MCWGVGLAGEDQGVSCILSTVPEKLTNTVLFPFGLLFQHTTLDIFCLPLHMSQYVKEIKNVFYTSVLKTSDPHFHNITVVST